MKTFKTLYKRTTGGGVQEWKIRVEEGANGSGILITTYGLQDGKKQEARDEIKEGKNIGRKNATTPLEQAMAEAKSRWQKQLDRKAYGLTVEDSAEVRESSPMLALPYGKHAKKVDWSTAFTQPKLDGFRCLAHITEDRKVFLTSRENMPMPALTDIRDMIQEMAKGTHVRGLDAKEIVLDGEMYGHGMSLNEVASACKKKSDKTKNIKFHVYDAMMGNANFETRSLFARDFVEAAGSGLLVPVETVKIRSEAELMLCQREFLEQGYEGAMLRYGSVGYQAGKRSAHLLKVKTFVDAEFQVVDYKTGRGKYANIPVFVCETKVGHHFDVTAPGSLPEKRAFLPNMKEYMGKFLTVKYQYYTKTAEPVPFLPVAVRFRTKPASSGKKLKK